MKFKLLKFTVPYVEKVAIGLAKSDGLKTGNALDL